MSDTVLELTALTRRFGTFTAVDAVTLSVNAGEVFGLVGSNGAGKTTTIKMLTTLLPPTSGGAQVAEFSITTQAVNVRRAIGYVPQAVSVDGSLTGFENLLIFAKLYDLPRREQIHRLTYRRTNHNNIHFRGYKEEGTFTTPFDMMVLNDLDRFHLVMDTIDRLPQTGDKGIYLKQQLKDKLIEHRQYIRKYGEDMPEIRNWKWSVKNAANPT